MLRCSADGFYFVSGAADGQCLLWQFGDLFADYSSQVLHGASQGRNEPKCIWTDHQGRVTDVACGRYGQFGKCITASLDGTCKVSTDTGSTCAKGFRVDRWSRWIHC